MVWGNPTEQQTKLRILILMAAYAYEFEQDLEPLCSDAEYDSACKMVDLSIPTTRPDLDQWFKDNFEPHTGMWIHNFPEIDGIKQLVKRKRS